MARPLAPRAPDDLWPEERVVYDAAADHYVALFAGRRVRTAGDLLIEYRIEQGGAVASIKVREWTGSAWGAAVRH